MMHRNLNRLSTEHFDVVVVGAGIYGICAAWDATLRGLSVAIVDRGDFSTATSAHCLKIVHGGFRYIQHADVMRMRESSHERNVLLRIAPHLVSPIPFVIPTYGHGLQGKGILSLALRLYNLVVADRNRGLTDEARRVPAGETLTREECLGCFPGLDSRGLTGGVVFYDGQMYNPPRLGLSYLRAAVEAGAAAANYVEATDFLRQGGRVVGIRARDLLGGQALEVRGKVVINASGPWVQRLLNNLDLRLRSPLAVTKDLYLVSERALHPRYALAVPGREKDPRAWVSRGTRHFFVIPWRGKALIGSSHLPYEGDPDKWEVTEQDIEELLRDVNDAYPSLGLTRADVSLQNSGLVPCGDHYGSRSRIIDHARDHAVEGLISLVGVRYTISRSIAARAVDLVFAKLGRRAPQSRTATTPIYGGQVERFDDLVSEARRRWPGAVDGRALDSLVHNYGSEYGRVLDYAREAPDSGRTLGSSSVITAEVIHAVREEMACKLGDVVFRRTELGTAGHPGEEALANCAATMAAELGWGPERVADELRDVQRAFLS